MEDKMTYEEAMKKLESVTDKLESGNTSMDEAFSLYEEGLKLTKFCEDYLSEKEKIVKNSEAE